jgi:hypothetical protein
MDDEEDDSFKPKTECGDCLCKDTCPGVCACKDGCPIKAEVLSEEAKKSAEDKAVELLISNGMLKRNAMGELEFIRINYRPTRVGRLPGSD